MARTLPAADTSTLNMTLPSIPLLINSRGYSGCRRVRILGGTSFPVEPWLRAVRLAFTGNFTVC